LNIRDVETTVLSHGAQNGSLFRHLFKYMWF